jgi:hypothetical protein
MRAAVIAAGMVISLACGTLPGGRRWGQDATIAPGTERLMTAVHDAAVDPFTWVPLAGAGVLFVGKDWDEHLQEWAVDKTPVFGSTDDADSAGHDLRQLMEEAWVVTMLATPSGDETGTWLLDKSAGFAVEWSAVELNSGLTSALKDNFKRMRPTQLDDDSFPSSGASDTFTFGTLAKRNLDAIDMQAGTRSAVQIGISTLSAAEAWSRVESGEHFPTDALVGAALGNFVARVVHDGFLGLPQDIWLTAYVDPGGDGASLGVTIRF